MLLISRVNSEKYNQTFSGSRRPFSGDGQSGECSQYRAQARNDAMGGTGVASADYGSGALINPALLARSQPEDDITVILPALQAQITDKDNLEDEIDHISDRVDYYRDVVNSLTPGDIAANPIGTLRQFRGAARELGDELEYLRGKTASARAAGGIAVSIPNDVLAVAFVAKAYAHARVSTRVDQSDIDYLRRIQNDDIYAGTQIINAAINGSDAITDRLTSTAFGRAAIVSDYGVAFAHRFRGRRAGFRRRYAEAAENPLYNYTASIYNYNSSDWNSSRYRNDDTGFNVDAGVAADFGPNWTVGVSGQNLMSRDIDTKEVNGYKDTYQISPLVTAGVAGITIW